VFFTEHAGESVNDRYYAVRKTASNTSLTNEQIIIMPEMANAVICPETGKSLKHQELITKVRYKIKWMRSTANGINRIYNTNTTRSIRR
jgi:hypothetical protein